jgi:hypothetical protein
MGSSFSMFHLVFDGGVINRSLLAQLYYEVGGCLRFRVVGGWYLSMTEVVTEFRRLDLMSVLIQTTALLLGVLLMILTIWSLFERTSGFSFCRLLRRVVVLQIEFIQPSSKDAFRNWYAIGRSRRGSLLVQLEVAHGDSRASCRQIPFEYRL